MMLVMRVGREGGSQAMEQMSFSTANQCWRHGFRALWRNWHVAATTQTVCAR